MRVTATHRGFYVKLREPGDEFDVPDALLPSKWLQPVEVAEPETVPAVVEPVVVEAPVVTEPAPAELVVKKRRGGRPRKVAVSE